MKLVVLMMMMLVMLLVMTMMLVNFGDEYLGRTLVDHNDGQFFRAMEWLMFFFRPPLPSMVFQWF